MGVSCSNIESEREYFSHIHNHLKSSETVSCMFEHCSFQTNVYGTFKSHKNRKHSSYSLQDFKPGVVRESGTQELIEDPLPAEEEDVDVSGSVEMVTEGQDLSKTIELKLASILLKLENYFQKTWSDGRDALHCWLQKQMASSVLWTWGKYDGITIYLFHSFKWWNK